MMPDDRREAFYELIDRQVYESHGLFASRQEAAEFARTANIKSYELWRDAELVEISH